MDKIPGLFDGEVEAFTDWKKRLGLNISERKIKSADIKIRPLNNVPDSILAKKINENRRVCGPGEHILIHFERGILVVRDDL